MKKRTRIIIGILFFGIYFLCVFYFLPKESLIYLKSDITDLKNILLPISILLSTVLAFLIIFNQKEFGQKKWQKLNHIIYIGIMSFLIYPMVSDSLLTFGLKVNRLSENDNVSENFIISVKDNYGTGENAVWGRIPDKTKYGKTEKLNLSQTIYNKVKENQEIEITLKIGIFGIPYEPVINE
jgi:hypothetical protein